jgi:hypothetical protein
MFICKCSDPQKSKSIFYLHLDSIKLDTESIGRNILGKGCEQEVDQQGEVHDKKRLNVWVMAFVSYFLASFVALLVVYLIEDCFYLI